MNAESLTDSHYPSITLQVTIGSKDVLNIVELIASVVAQRIHKPTLNHSSQLLTKTSDGFERLAFSINETASILGVAPKTVRRLIQRGLLRSSNSLRHKLIPKQEIQRFLAQTLSFPPFSNHGAQKISKTFWACYGSFFHGFLRR